MATNSPAKQEFAMPMPPPQLQPRSENEHPSPSTPTNGGFTSPSQTPQGSPSKKQFPQGAHDLPSIFDNALKLNPTQGNANTQAPHQQVASSPASPTKSGRTPLADHAINDFRSSVIQDDKAAKPTLPVARGNENTPPSPSRAHQESPFANQAAISRHDAYQRKTYQGPTTRSMQMGLSSEDMEKLQKSSVRRLANVTQLCE